MNALIVLLPALPALSALAIQLFASPRGQCAPFHQASVAITPAASVKRSASSVVVSVPEA